MRESGKIHVGVIGAGGIAESVHLPSLKEIGEASLCAICDIHVNKAQRLAGQYGIQGVYANYLDMVDKEALDAVFVLVQPDQSFRIALDCLDKGLDVFMEKPAGITAYQAETLYKKSVATGKLVQVGLNRRYIPLVSHVLHTLKQVTEITQVEGCFYKNGDAAFYSGCASSFICDVIHVIDLVRYASGSDTLPVQAKTISNKVNSDEPNVWHSVFRFDNGVTGGIRANYQTGGRVHLFEFHGPEASAYVNLGFGGSECQARILYFNGRKSQSAASFGLGHPEMEIIDGINVAGHKDYYGYYGYLTEDRAFLQCVVERKQPMASIREAMLSMQMTEMLDRAID